MKIKLSLLFVSLLLVNGVLSAQKWWKNGIRGEGDVLTEEVRLDRISGIKNNFSCDVYLTQGDKQTFRMEGQENILANILLDVDRNGILTIKSDRPVRTHKQVSVYLTVADLRMVKVAGSGNVKTESSFQHLDDVALGISGSGNLDLELEAEDIVTKITGSGNVSLSGSSRSIEVGITGSGNLNAFDLSAADSEVTITGSGSANVNVNSALDAKIVGSGSVHYKGGARDIDSKITGSGSVRSAR